MYDLEICHPNEMIHNGWRKVDEFFDTREMSHYLRSPTFETFDGLLVRVQGYTTAIYTENGLIDLGVSSGFKNAYIWNFDSDACEFCQSRNYAEMWAECEYASWMIHGISSFMPRKIISRVNLMIARRIRSIMIGGSTSFNVDEILRDAENSIDIREKARHVQDQAWRVGSCPWSDQLLTIYSAVMTLYGCAPWETSIHACAAKSRIARGLVDDEAYNSAQKEFSDLIREVLPFHEIVQSIIALTSR